MALIIDRKCKHFSDGDVIELQLAAAPFPGQAVVLPGPVLVGAVMAAIESFCASGLSDAGRRTRGAGRLAVRRRGPDAGRAPRVLQDARRPALRPTLLPRPRAPRVQRRVRCRVALVDLPLRPRALARLVFVPHDVDHLADHPLLQRVDDGEVHARADHGQLAV